EGLHAPPDQHHQLLRLAAAGPGHQVRPVNQRSGTGGVPSRRRLPWPAMRIAVLSDSYGNLPALEAPAPVPAAGPDHGHAARRPPAPGGPARAQSLAAGTRPGRTGAAAGFWRTRPSARACHARRFPGTRVYQVRSTSSLAVASRVSGVLGWSLVPLLGTLVA